MEVKYNSTGPARKELVKAIENITGKKAIYKKVPSCAYMVEGYTITKEGTLQWDESTDVSAAKLVVKRLADAGFAAEDLQVENIDPDNTGSVEEGLCIQIPKSGISDFELDLVKKMISCLLLASVSQATWSPSLSLCSLDMRHEAGVIFLKYPSCVMNSRTG